MVFKGFKPVGFEDIYRYIGDNRWVLTPGYSIDTRVIAYRLSSRYHEIGAVLEPHRAVIYRDCGNDIYDFGDEKGYFVTTFESIKHWIKARLDRRFIYRLEFSYGDLMVCNLNKELIQGFVRGKVKVLNRCILRT